MAQGTAVAARRARATARHVRMTPMKVRRVVDLIRGMEAREALTVLQFAPQAASEPVAKVLASAVANAENNERLDPDSLLVVRGVRGRGADAKRFRPRAQGRAYRISKRTSHITIEVESVAAAPASRRRPRRRRQEGAGQGRQGGREGGRGQGRAGDEGIRQGHQGGEGAPPRTRRAGGRRRRPCGRHAGGRRGADHHDGRGRHAGQDRCRAPTRRRRPGRDTEEGTR